MTSLQRAGAELLGLLLLVGCFAFYWQVHNRVEQKAGAQACLHSTTQVKTEVAADNSDLIAAHQAQLNQVVAVYEQKLADSAGANADLARRLRDNGLRQSPAPGPRSAACISQPDRGLPESKGAPDAGPGRVAEDTAALLDACDADHAKLKIVTDAYNGWRQQMIEANAKR